MPLSEYKSELAQMIFAAESLLIEIEDEILLGNDAQADSLSKQYEGQLENIFRHKSQSRELLIMKLEFSKKVISVDHPAEALVDRVFSCLSEDIRSLMAGE